MKALARGPQRHDPVKALIVTDDMDRLIYTIRGRRVMLDRDLAKIYGVSTMRLNEQVKRNKARFPDDFMFRLTKDEMEYWISQFAISNSAVKMRLRKASGHDKHIQALFDAIDQIMDPPVGPRKEIGFSPKPGERK